MLSVLCRSLGIAALATGLALLVFPDPSARVVRQPVENVLLTTVDMDRYAAAVGTACGEAAAELAHEGLSEGHAFRTFLTAMDWSGPGERDLILTAAEWAALRRQVTPDPGVATTFCARVGVRLLRFEMEALQPPADRFVVHVRFLGEAPPSGSAEAQPLDASTLQPFPAIREQLAAGAAALEGTAAWVVQEMTALDGAEWRRFAAAAKLSPDASFNYAGRVYQAMLVAGAVGEQMVPAQRLGSKRYVAAAILAIVGLALMLWLYRPGRSIPMVPRGVAALWDVLFLAAALPVGYGAIDAALSGLWGYQPILGPVMRFVGIAGMAVGIPVMAIVLTILTAQRLEVTAADVATAGVGGRLRLAWDDLTGLAFEARYLATVKAGVPVPRKLQRVLVLKGQAVSLTVQEPPTAAGKARVVDALAAAAPAEWRDRIRTMGANW
ncbi:MAG TPA: hypothetical protein PLN26_05835 [Acidobacteriota bacterium]|nr:hypothetical protein [Acidobacteriota bacterium]HQG91467.1 hypothetical protein [Acidobacteriota bacterium]